MKVSEIMSINTKTVNVSDSLHQAAELMWQNDCGALPVLDESGAVMGMVTDRDIAMACFTKGKTLDNIRVEECMSRHTYACNENEDIQVAESIMKNHQVRRLPVINNDSKLTGIVAVNDLALACKKDSGADINATELVDMLAGICAHRQHGRASAA